ncbi:LCE1C isoform 2, partial [Pongo abelii]
MSCQQSQQQCQPPPNVSSGGCCGSSSGGSCGSSSGGCCSSGGGGCCLSHHRHRR